MATKHHHVLVISADGAVSTALTCTMLGMAAHFRRDPNAVITSLTSRDPRPHLQPKGLLFGRKEAKDGRLVVLSQFLSQHRAQQYEVVPDNLMKGRLMAWIDGITSLPQETVGAMTLIFACHGDRAGGVHFGPRHALMPHELLSKINSEVNSAIPVSLYLLQCFAGMWIPESRQHLTRRNILIHAACGPNEKSGPVRSLSNRYRCSLFGAAVVETLAENAMISTTTYEGGVRRIMSREMAKPNYPHVHTPELALTTSADWDLPVSKYAGPIGSPTNNRRSERRSTDTAAADIPLDPSQFPNAPLPYHAYSQDGDFVLELTRRADAMSVQMEDLGVLNLLHMFNPANPPNHHSNMLREMLNGRRKRQRQAAALLKSWIDAGAVSYGFPTISDSSFDMETCDEISKNNQRTLVELIPELQNLSYVKVGENFDLFEAPLVWLVNSIYAATSVDIGKMLDVAVTIYGLAVKSGVTNSKAVFGTGHPLGNGRWTFGIIDPIVPNNAKTAKTFDPFAVDARDLNIL